MLPRSSKTRARRIRSLAVYLGHGDPGFSLRVYTHFLPSAPDRTRRVIDEAASELTSHGPDMAQGDENVP